MAHADYDCCACCDRKLCFRHDGGETKETLCGRCAARLSLAAGREIGDVEQFVAWVRAGEPEAVLAALHAAGYRPCHYPNEVDAVVRTVLGARLPGFPD